MNTLVLLLDRKSEWSPLVWAKQQGGEIGVGGQVMIENPNGWLSVLRNDHVLHEYDEEERIVISRVLARPALFVVEWKGKYLVESLLQATPPRFGALVDNDHGVLVPIQEVRELPIESWARKRVL